MVAMHDWAHLGLFGRSAGAVGRAASTGDEKRAIVRMEETASHVRRLGGGLNDGQRL
jgi:hypothetical protein